MCALLQSLLAVAFLTSSNWLISTVPSWNLAGDFEFSAHGFDEILERAHVHVRAAFEFGYGGLVDAENFGEMHLRYLASLPEFVQSHAGTIPGCEPTGTLLGCGGHLGAERVEILGQRGSPVIGHSTAICC
jgi:hypothetical protein